MRCENQDNAMSIVTADVNTIRIATIGPASHAMLKSSARKAARRLAEFRMMRTIAQFEFRVPGFMFYWQRNLRHETPDTVRNFLVICLRNGKKEFIVFAAAQCTHCWVHVKLSGGIKSHRVNWDF